MRSVLVTGSGGRVGKRVIERLEQVRWITRPFDLVSGQDLRDRRAVLDAAEDVDVIVHCGGLAHDTAGDPADIVATNVLGTWHVLLAAEREGVDKVVAISSAQVFGFAEGEGVPDSLPIDDSHPRRAARPYGMSKRLIEEMCDAWTSRTGIPTLVLRPVLVLDENDLGGVSRADVELGAFVHLDDVAEAVVRAVETPVSGHRRMTICGPGPFDTSAARDLLGWAPQRTWPGAG